MICQIFNGAWEARQTAGCTWFKSKSENPAIRAVIVVTEGTVTLGYFGIIGGDIAVYSIFQGSMQEDDECCSPITLEFVEGNCEGVGSVTVTPFCCTPPCSSRSSRSPSSRRSPSSSSSSEICNPRPCEHCNCTRTPLRWNFNVSGYQGEFFRLNRNWEVRQNTDSGCLYSQTIFFADDSFVKANVDITATAVLLSLFTKQTGGGVLSTFFSAPFDRDCCIPRTATFVSGDSGTVQSVTLTPYCCTPVSPCSSPSSSPSSRSSSSMRLGAGCCGCAAVPFTYSLLVAGITASGACASACTAFNKTWTLNTVTPCVWDTGDVGACPGCASPSWSLACDGLYFYLTPCLSATGVFYRKLKSEWNCLGSNELDYVPPEVTDCADWPATLTVVPI